MFQFPPIEEVDKSWFYLRKALFQGLLPITLKLITLFNFEINSKPFYQQTYFYTGLILGLYGCMTTGCQLIFDIYSVPINLKKHIDLNETTPELLFSAQYRHGGNQDIRDHIPVHRRIFKFRYSQSMWFLGLSRVCWWLGVDCPLLIPLQDVDDWIPSNLYPSILQQSQIQPSKMQSSNYFLMQQI